MVENLNAARQKLRAAFYLLYKTVLVCLYVDEFDSKEKIKHFHRSFLTNIYLF